LGIQIVSGVRALTRPFEKSGILGVRRLLSEEPDGRLSVRGDGQIAKYRSGGSMWESISGRRSRSNEGEGARMLGVGLLVGAIVGATAALLMAPASGTDTRRVLRRKARSLAKQGGGMLEDTWSDAERAARVGMKRARKQAAMARSAARSVARDAADAGRRRFGLD
jgi:gas vesicle protein